MTKWRVYRIERPDDISKAISLFSTRIGTKPKRARISSKASNDLLKALQGLGLEIEIATNQLAYDLWLTDESAMPEQMALF